MNTIRTTVALNLIAATLLPLALANPSLGADQNWSYTYNVNGQILTADGPRTDINDITTYTYDASGNRSSATNAIGHQVKMQNYNGRGQPGLIIDANGIQTVLSYHDRGWLLSGTVKGPGGNSALDAATTYAYDDEGQLLSTTLPNGSMLFNEYDAAQRLVAISNTKGERIEYTLDDAGNRTAEVTRTGNGSITRSLTQAYDELNRLIQLTGAAGQTTTYAYDKNGKQVTITDGNFNSTNQDHDALGRLTSSLAPLSHHVYSSHDDQGNLVRITDPEGLITTYNYDGHNNLTQLSSPDTGVSYTPTTRRATG